MADHLQVQQQHQLDLPPGFRFKPTDVQIITYYLVPKVLNKPFDARAVGEVNLNNYEPWDIPKKENMEDKEQYFFSKKDLKYPTGIRANRATTAGYWKATGKDKEIVEPSTMSLIGMMKTLVFYKGRAPKGEKTNWVMHEYRLDIGKQPKPGLNTDIINAAAISASSKEEYVFCKIFDKSTGVKKSVMPSYNMPMSMGAEQQQQGILESNYFPHLMEYDASSSLVPLLPLRATSSYQLQPTGPASSVMGTVMPPMMNNHYFGDHNQMMAAPPQSQISFYLPQYQQMVQMGLDQSFMVGVDHGSGPSSILSQEDALTGMSNNAQGNEATSTADEISFVNMGMDGMWRY